MQSRQQSRGLSLLESVLAVSLLAILGLALLEIFLRSTVAQGHAKQARDAGELADSLLDIARAQTFSTYLPDTTIPLPDVSIYKSTLITSTIASQNNKYLKQLSVRVTWKDKNLDRNQTRSVYVANLVP